MVEQEPDRKTHCSGPLSGPPVMAIIHQMGHEVGRRGCSFCDRMGRDLCKRRLLIDRDINGARNVSLF